MARLGRDLFEILGARAGSGRAHKSPAPEATSVASGSGPFARLREAFSRAPAPRRTRARPLVGPERALSGFSVAVLVFTALATGFAVGRWTNAAGSPDDLRRPASGTAPAWLDRAAELSAQETEKLSNSAYLLLRYPRSERLKAASVARWLRTQGVTGTRVLPVRLADGVWYYVVCYVVEDRARVFDQLCAIAGSPEFAPELRMTLDKLERDNPKPHTFKT